MILRLLRQLVIHHNRYRWFNSKEIIHYKPTFDYLHPTFIIIDEITPMTKCKKILSTAFSLPASDTWHTHNTESMKQLVDLLLYVAFGVINMKANKTKTLLRYSRHSEWERERERMEDKTSYETNVLWI